MPETLIIMGTCGSGKTTIGQRVAESLGGVFYEGDSYHSKENIDKMSKGEALSDKDREPWLLSLHNVLDSSTASINVLACSALKKSYRDMLVGTEKKISVTFVYLKGTENTLRQRVQNRKDKHFMLSDMVPGQLSILEEPSSADGNVIIMDIEQSPDVIVSEICKQWKDMIHYTAVTSESDIEIKLSDFGPGFNLHSWVNNILSKTNTNSNDQRSPLLSLTTKLQLGRDDIQSSIKTTVGTLIENIPTSLNEIEKMEKETKELNRILHDTLQQVTVFNNENNEAVQFLSQIDIIKTRVETTEKMIGEIEHWKDRCRNIENLFEQYDYNIVAKEIKALKTSLLVIEGLPKFKQNQSQVKIFQERLELIIIPQLLNVLKLDLTELRTQKHRIEKNKNDEKDNATTTTTTTTIDHSNNDHISSLKDLVNIFYTIGNIDMLYKYYFQSRYDLLESIAIQYAPFTDAGKEICSRLVTWLPSFLQDLDLLIKYEEITILKYMIPDDETDMTAVHAELIEKLCKQTSQYIAKWTSSYVISEKEDGVIGLCKILHITETFMCGLYNDHVVNKSKSYHFNTISSLLIPFQSYVNEHYCRLEKKYLFTQFHDMNFNQLENYDSSCEILRLTSSKVFTIAAEARDRFIKLTHGAETISFISCLDSFFTEYIEKLTNIIGRLRRKATPPIEDKKTTVAPTAMPVATAVKASAPVVVESGKVTSIESSFVDDTDNFKDLQGIFELIRVCDSIHTQLLQFETQNFTLIMKTLQKLFKQAVKDNNNNNNSNNDDEKNIMERMILKSHISSLPSNIIQELSIFYKKNTKIIKTSKVPVFLPAADQLFTTFLTTLDTMAYEIMFHDLSKLLREFETWDAIWNQSDVSSNDALPGFSIQASQYMTDVGECLFSLVQSIEPFVTAADNEEQDEEIEGSDNKHDVAFWLEFVGEGLTSLLIKKMKLIPLLSNKGCIQLACDLEYVLNIFSAFSLNTSNDQVLYAAIAVLNAPKPTYAQMADSLKSNEDLNSEGKEFLMILNKIRQTTTVISS